MNPSTTKQETTADRRELGFLGENVAGRYLESQGYRILDRNYRKLSGEIDLVVERDNQVAFVEVKTNRKSYGFDFNPEVRVNPRKVAHISRTALIYLENKGWLDSKEWRIDIVSVVLDRDSRSAKIKHFKNVASDIY